MKLRPFFSRRVLLLAVALTVLLYVLGGFVLHKSNEHMTRRHKNQGITRQKEAFNKLSSEEKAIKKTQDYLTSSITFADTTERIFFSYLQRKFDLDPALGAEKSPIATNKDSATYPDHINYLMRIAYPNEIVREKPGVEDLESNLQVTNIYSANCDHMDVPANFWTIMNESADAGGYFASHVALALEMMESNGCVVPPVATSIEDKTVQAMMKVIDDPNTAADLRYESIAFLLMRDRRDLVKQEWIDQIIEEQHTDGVWSIEGENSTAGFHSTLLAFWSLLEYSRPDTPDEPLILRPSH